ncbi:MAG: thioredoxin family protein [Turicibacter sp.]|nr:thioredoxin family protein [Turicibacter sp.]
MDSLGLEEIGYDRFLQQSMGKGVLALLVYTPTCGTCQLAKKIMGVVAKGLPQVGCVQLNLNHHEQLAIDFKVQSVPCLLIFKEGEFLGSFYRFSVLELYQHLENILAK